MPNRAYEFPCILGAIWRRLAARAAAVQGWLRSRIVFACAGIRVGRGVSVCGKIYVNNRRRRDIRIGDGVVFQARFQSNFAGLLNPTVLDTLGGGSITIGDFSGFSSVVISSRSSVTIGRHVKVGANVRIYDHDFHALDPAVRRSREDAAQTRTRPVEIGDEVFIGAQAMILKGSRIGARSIVAAGSVVFGLEVPPDSLVWGNPAALKPRKKTPYA